MKILYWYRVNAISAPLPPAHQMGLNTWWQNIVHKSKPNYSLMIICQVSCVLFKMETLKFVFIFLRLQS